MKAFVERTDEQALTAAQRWAGLIIVVAMLLLFCFFAYHELANTGLFTAAFGPLEMFCLYGPILLALVAPIARALNGRQNPARPFEAATNMFMAIGALWLVIVFPFDFSHLADVLPGAIRFVLSWITNDIGRVLLLLQVVVGPISALTTTLKYLSVRRQEPATRSIRQTP